MVHRDDADVGLDSTDLFLYSRTLLPLILSNSVDDTVLAAPFDFLRALLLTP